MSFTDDTLESLADVKSILTVDGQKLDNLLALIKNMDLTPDKAIALTNAINDIKATAVEIGAKEDAELNPPAATPSTTPEASAEASSSDTPSA